MHLAAHGMPPRLISLRRRRPIPAALRARIVSRRLSRRLIAEFTSRPVALLRPPRFAPPETDRDHDAYHMVWLASARQLSVA